MNASNAETALMTAVNTLVENGDMAAPLDTTLLVRDLVSICSAADAMSRQHVADVAQANAIRATLPGRGDSRL